MVVRGHNVQYENVLGLLVHSAQFYPENGQKRSNSIDVGVFWRNFVCIGP